MATQRFETINDVVNHVAVEIGMEPVADVFAASDFVFTQLTHLVTTCTQELMELFDWQILIREHQILTQEDETGKYDLPSDFGYMIPQTGWERNENVPLIGPLSAQDWTYLLGRDLVGSTIYASFRYDQNQLWIFPNDPVTANLNINFEYVSRNVIQIASTEPAEYTDKASAPGDVVLFPPHLIKRMLRMKFLDVKGFDSQKATDDFWQALQSWQGKDNTASILNAARWRYWYPYLDPYRNLPDSGYGGGVG
jgi:hypothetical protein